MAFPCFPNTSSSDLFTIPTQPIPQGEAVMVSSSGVVYVTHSTTTSSIFTQYVGQEPPLWPPSLPQFQLMRNPTAQPLVGLGQPVTDSYIAYYPEQQHSSITPRAERQRIEKYINLSNFPSEKNMIDRLLPSNHNKYIPPQTEKRTRNYYLTDDTKAELIQKISAGDKEDAELAEEYRVPVTTVQYYRRKIGVFLRLPGKKEKVLSEEEIDNLKQDLCMSGERPSDDKLQKKYDISTSTLRKVKKSVGSYTKKDYKKPNRLTMGDELNLIDDLLNKGTTRLSNTDLADKYNISTSTIKRKIKQYQLQPTYYIRICDVSDNFQRDSPFLLGEDYVNPVTNR